MLEAIFNNSGARAASTGAQSRVSRPALISPAPATKRQQQPSPLESFLKAQTYGKQTAGNNAVATQSVKANAPSTSFQANFAPQAGAAATTDPNAIQTFYSDPAHADYHSDPALLNIKAANNTTRDNADVAALKSRRQLLAQLGSRAVALKTLGSEDPTLAAVSDNPDESTSVLARLARSYRDTVNANEDARNKGNLWYSSDRAHGLNQDAQDYSTLQADAIGNAQSQLDAITSGVSGAKTSADQGDAAAEQEAFNRYLSAVSAHPASSTPGGGAAGGAGAAGAAGAGAAAPYDPYPPDQQDRQAAAAPIESAFASPQMLDAIAAAANDPAAAAGSPPEAWMGVHAPTESGAPFASPQMLDALASYLLKPQPKKPVSGYAETSGSPLH